MTTVTFQEKYNSLKKYSKHLKSQLKLHSGESVRKGSSIENKLRIYKKIRKLLSYLDDLENAQNDEKGVRRLDEYYTYLEHKCKKLEHSENIQKIANDEKESFLEASKSKEQNTISLADPVPSTIESDTEYEELSEITEMGPTPQLNGRVLTIFDIQTSPEKFEMSPVKGKVDGSDSKLDLDLGITLDPHDNDDKIFKTPSKITSTLSYASLDSTSRKLDFGSITPVKNVSKASSISTSGIYETPKYLRTQTLRLNNVDEIIIGDQWSENEDEDEEDDEAEEEKPLSSIMLSDDETQNDAELKTLTDLDLRNNIEPSPIIKRSGRSLFELHKDMVGLKRNLTDLQELMKDDDIPIIKDETTNEAELIKTFIDIENHESDKDVEKGNDEPDDDEVTKVFDPHYKLRNKIKTIKRSTRRAKLRTEKLDTKDALDDLDIHALAFGKRKLEFDEDQNQPNVNVDNGNNSGSSDEFEEDEIYQRKDIEQLQKELNVGKSKGKGKHPLSNNFVRLKINRGSRGRFKRRR